MMFSNKEKVHLIGIGGIGMSGIAQLLLASGCIVSGSDLKPSSLIEKLKGLGVKVFIGHHPDNIKDANFIIYSSAIKQNNPELLAAHSQGRGVLTRAAALAVLANKKNLIAVTGAHGKTTTSSLIAHMLVKCGLKPTVCVGGELFSLDGNAFLGEGDFFVLEADESDGSFLNLDPLYSVVTNIDREHLDYYRDLEHIRATFERFMHNTKKEGCLFFSQDDAELVKIVPALRKKAVSYGLASCAQILAKDISLWENRSSFSCIYQGQDLGKITLQIPGRHNVCNSLAAIGVGLELGLKFHSLQEALSSYSGVRRRQELKLKKEDLLIFEDYAHHPTEIKATLEAFQNFRHKRLLAVFQPHRYTRTKYLIEEFGMCFGAVDYLIVTDIYPASEVPIQGVNAENICRKAQEAGVKEVCFLPKEDIVKHLLEEIKSGDLVAIMGAGDIGSIADELAKQYRHRVSIPNEV